MLSIRVRITAITIAAILTSILVVFFAFSSTIQEENDKRSIDTMNLLCQNTKHVLEEYLESISNAVEMSANIADDSLDSVRLVENGVGASFERTHIRTEEQQEELEDYLAEYTAKLQETVRSIANHTHGIVTYYYCISPEISSTEHGFFYSRVGKTGFEKQPPLNAGELDPEDTGHSIWYFTTIQRGRPSWVGPYTDSYLNEMYISSYLVPIYNSGSLIGVIGMDIPMDTLIDQVKDVQVYETGFACLLDSDGCIIYHPTMEAGSYPDLKGMSLNDDLLKQKNGGNELIRYSIDNVERQMTFVTLSNGMKLVISAPTSEINASWNRLVRVIILITVLVIAFYVVLLLIATNLITRPLKRLTAASQKLAAADYDVELNYKGRDEVGVLTKAFSQMRDQIKLQIEDLNRRIYTDSLTGLPNMKYFFILEKEEKSRILENGGSPAILYFDLTGMKHFNRQYSFEEGDKLLCDVGRILQNHYGEKCISHLGQGRYVVITDENGLEEVLHEVFLDLQSANEGKTVPVIVGIYPDKLDEVSVNIAIDRAKFASDLHRGSYISAFYYFDRSMLQADENARYIITHLDQALEEKWVQVFYQPIVRSSDFKVCDEESLSRWFDPERGMFSPGEFIPVLENAHLIYKLDLYVLDEVLAKMKQIESSGVEAASHSINLSRSDFDTCDIVEEICKRVDAAGISRNKITIEITESMIGSDFEFMKKQVERFRNLGFPVWMDDFGSGYSSLDVLQDIHFDVIKFDMSFLHHMEENDNSKIILTELMQMAFELGMETVCEGVETEKQVQFLKEIGCSKLQGYYFSKPVSLDVSLKKYTSQQQE